MTTKTSAAGESVSAGWFPLNAETRQKLQRSWSEIYKFDLTEQATTPRRAARRAVASAKDNGNKPAPSERPPLERALLLQAWRGVGDGALLSEPTEEEAILEKFRWPPDRTGRGPAWAPFPGPVAWPSDRAGWPADRAGWSGDRAGWPRDRAGSEGFPRVWPRDRITGRSLSMGYLPDVPDARDFGVRSPEYREPLVALEKRRGSRGGGSEMFQLGHSKNLPSVKCFSLLPGGHFSHVRDQGPIGSCTAQATLGALEYLISASGLGRLDLSPLFLYKVTRRVAGLYGDSGAYIREAIKAARLFGVPPEAEWPYLIERMEHEPEAFLYSYAANFKSIRYARLDGYGAANGGDATLRNMKQSILDGFPVIFGFPIHESITSMTGPDYVVPPPQSEHDKRLGGHAVLAVGFDDEVAVPSSSLPNFTEDDKRGALIFRNSWGPDWGCGGYACLPYYYVRHCLAIDCWTILQTDWLDLEVFD